MKLSTSQQLWTQSAILILAFMPLFWVAHHLDMRQYNDLGIWIKPLKFHVSTAVHLLTFAVVVHFLPAHMKHARWLVVIAFISAAATLFELFLIDMQAFRGVGSHFNFSSSFNALVYAMMGIAALLLTIPALILGIVFARVPSSETLTPGLKYGIALGLIVGCILTLAIAGYMSSSPSGHWVDAPATDQGGVPLVGWTKQGGDLRVPHFFATHLMQILPLLGWLIDRKLSLRSLQAKLSVIAATFGGVAITVFTLLQALAGKPFIA